MKWPDLGVWNFVFRDWKWFWKRPNTTQMCSESIPIARPVVMSIQPAFKNLPIWWRSAQPLPPALGNIARSPMARKESPVRVVWHEGRVYFALAFDNQTHNVCTTIDECQEEDALNFWREALASSRYGLCRNGYYVFRSCIELQLQIIQAPDGSGLMREWWNLGWTAFPPPRGNSLTSLVEPEEHWPHIFRRSPKCEEEFLLRSVSEEDSARFVYRTATNEREFQKVVPWLWTLGFLRLQQGRMGAQVQCFSGRFPFRGCLELGAGVDWAGHTEFLLWLQRYFVVEGAQWKKTHYGRRKLRRLRAQEPRMRLFFGPHFSYWSCYFKRGDEPTFHQQLEARLDLRDWLRDKAPAEQIEAWLGSPT